MPRQATEAIKKLLRRTSSALILARSLEAGEPAPSIRDEAAEIASKHDQPVAKEDGTRSTNAAQSESRRRARWRTNEQRHRFFIGVFLGSHGEQLVLCRCYEWRELRQPASSAGFNRIFNRHELAEYQNGQERG